MVDQEKALFKMSNDGSREPVTFELNGFGITSGWTFPEEWKGNREKMASVINLAVRQHLGLPPVYGENAEPDYVDTTGVVVEDIQALKVVDNALVPVYEWKGIHGVSARDIHSTLGVGKVFAAWIRDRIEKYNFTAGEDYFPILENRSDGRAGKPRTEYFLTMDTAKEIAMVENNEKGRMIRRHFIEIEKKYRAGIALEPPKEPGIIEPPKAAEPLALPEPETPEVLPRAISSRYPDKRYWTPEEAAAELGLAGYRVLYDKLVDLGLVKRTKQGVVPLKERREFIRQWTFKSKGGNNSKRPVITPWGMDYLESVL